MNIGQSAMYYISMDSSRQALQIKGKLSSYFGIIFRISYNFFLIIVALGLCMRGGGGICADQHVFQLLNYVAMVLQEVYGIGFLIQCKQSHVSLFLLKVNTCFFPISY